MLLTKPAISTKVAIVLHGVEGAYGWTLVVGIQDGSMAVTLLDREGAFVLFGSCTTL